MFKSYLALHNFNFIWGKEFFYPPATCYRGIVSWRWCVWTTEKFGAYRTKVIQILHTYSSLQEIAMVRGQRREMVIVDTNICKSWWSWRFTFHGEILNLLIFKVTREGNNEWAIMLNQLHVHVLYIGWMSRSMEDLKICKAFKANLSNGHETAYSHGERSRSYYRDGRERLLIEFLFKRIRSKQWLNVAHNAR